MRDAHRLLRGRQASGQWESGNSTFGVLQSFIVSTNFIIRNYYHDINNKIGKGWRRLS
jgi:hypothetical protein